jgi:hypothetical protein
MLRDNPFVLLCTIGEMQRISPETVRLHLLRIGDVLKAFHWVPHILTDDPKLIHIAMCQTMLVALRVQEHNQWHNSVTGEESRFYFEHVRGRLLISSLENAPDYPNRTIVTEKHMLTVFWNPDGFQVVTILAKEELFNATWFTDGHLVPLRDLCFRGEGDMIRGS